MGALLGGAGGLWAEPQTEQWRYRCGLCLGVLWSQLRGLQAGERCSEDPTGWGGIQ